jgi:hypothetical protein
MRGWWRFVLGGLKQAAWVVATVLVLGAVGWLGVANDAMWHVNRVMVGFAVSILSGPVPPLLTCFDITNSQLFQLCSYL